MESKKIILVPTDFSEVCDNAIHHAVKLAKELNYKVTLLHVIDKTTKSQLKDEDKDFKVVDEKLAAIAGTYHKETGVEIDFVSLEGNIFDDIAKIASEINAELMFLGTHGKKGLQHITGSYAYKVVTSATCPTVVVQNRSIESGYNNIVFPVQEIVYVRQKVQWTIKVAKIFNATIHLYMIDSRVEEIRNKLKIVVSQIKQIFTDHDVKYIIKYSDGASNFTNQCIAYASAQRADLIMIISTNDLFEFKIIPSEEKIIFNKAQIPVLCVNPREMYAYSFNL